MTDLHRLARPQRRLVRRFLQLQQQNLVVYRTLAVQPTAWYELQAQIYHDDEWAEAVPLLISWYGTGSTRQAVSFIIQTQAAMNASEQPKQNTCLSHTKKS